MQPILAESAPHRGRAVAISVALAAVASLLLVMSPSHRSRHRGHHQLPRIGKCSYAGHAYLLR